MPSIQGCPEGRLEEVGGVYVSEEGERAVGCKVEERRLRVEKSCSLMASSRLAPIKIFGIEGEKAAAK